jgi:hypothetical protein
MTRLVSTSASEAHAVSPPGSARSAARRELLQVKALRRTSMPRGRDKLHRAFTPVVVEALLARMSSGSPATDQFLDLICHDTGVFVLPRADDLPAVGSELAVRVGIPATIELYLVSPPVGVGLGPGCVDRATVPETAVDEDRHLHGSKNQVRLASDPDQRPYVHPEAQTSPMQRRP